LQYFPLWAYSIFTYKGGVTLYVNDQLEYMELCLGMDEELTESSWVRIKGRAGTGDITVGGLLQATQPGRPSG